MSFLSPLLSFKCFEFIKSRVGVSGAHVHGTNLYMQKHKLVLQTKNPKGIKNFLCTQPSPKNEFADANLNFINGENFKFIYC